MKMKLTHRIINGSLYVYNGKAAFKNLVAAFHHNCEEFKNDKVKSEVLKYLETLKLK